MRNPRFLTALLVALTLPLLGLAQNPLQTSAPPPPEPEPTEAELALDEAIAALESIGSVRAKVIEDVDMLGQKFTLEGEYLRQDQTHFRLQLRAVGLPGNPGRMLKVCNGNVLYDYTRLLNQNDYYRVDLTELIQVIGQEPFEEIHRNAILRQQVGVIGPLGLLEGLRASVRFDRQLKGTYQGKPVSIYRGTWKDMSAFGLGPMATIQSVPAYLPSLVEVVVDESNGWPYRVKLYGKQRSVVTGGSGTPKLDPISGRPVGSTMNDEEPVSTFVLSYVDVDFEPDYDPALEFAFAPPEAERNRVVDRTRELLQQVDQIKQILLAQQQQEQSQGGGTTNPSGSLLNGGFRLDPPQ